MKLSYNTRNLVVISLFVAVINLTVPYLFLADHSQYWINYLFWAVLTLFVMFIGFLYVKDWGEPE
ncbi:MAG: hypothetical protein ACOC53_04905 [Candidatus Saliniplasma sp.]